MTQNSDEDNVIVTDTERLDDGSGSGTVHSMAVNSLNITDTWVVVHCTCGPFGSLEITRIDP